MGAGGKYSLSVEATVEGAVRENLSNSFAKPNRDRSTVPSKVAKLRSHKSIATSPKVKFSELLRTIAGFQY
jgi:hypothetical protein